MIQRWLAEATKWDNFQVVDVGQYMVDLVTTLKDSRNTNIPLNNGQSTNLGTALKIMMEGKQLFDTELTTPSVAMDTSEDFQARVAAVSSSPALSYATLPKRKGKGKAKTKAKPPVLIAPSGGPNNAIVIPDTPLSPIPANLGPPLRLSSPRLNPKALPGLPPLVNAVAPIKVPAHPPL
jgi:hypothetical protein